MQYRIVMADGSPAPYNMSEVHYQDKKVAEDMFAILQKRYVSWKFKLQERHVSSWA